MLAPGHESIAVVIPNCVFDVKSPMGVPRDKLLSKYLDRFIDVQRQQPALLCLLKYSKLQPPY